MASDATPPPGARTVTKTDAPGAGDPTGQDRAAPDATTPPPVEDATPRGMPPPSRTRRRDQSAPPPVEDAHRGDPTDAATPPPVEQRATAATRPDASRTRTWFRYTLPGAWTALIFACLSFSPTLLPRPGIIQGLVCGITAAIGYGLGVVGAAVWRAFPDRPARPARRRSWQIFFGLGAVLLVACYLLGRRWQLQIRELMDAPSRAVLLAAGAADRGRADLRRASSRSGGCCASSTAGSRACSTAGWASGRRVPSAGSRSPASRCCSSPACCSTA